MMKKKMMPSVRTIILILSMLISVNVMSQEVKVNITSREKLKEFFEKNFPEPKWSKEEEESFKAYISSITKDMNRDNIFLWKGDINANKEPTAFLLLPNEYSGAGVFYYSFFVLNYSQGKWDILFAMKKDLGKYVLIKNKKMNYYKDNYERYINFGIYTDLSGRKLLEIIHTFKSDSKLIENNYPWIYSHRLRNYEHIGGYVFLDKEYDYRLWFEYNYPENSDKWPKDAETSFESDVKTDKWDLVHKGDLLRSGNPVYLAIKYAEGDKEGKKVIFLNKLKLMEYVSNKWKERVFIGDSGRMDGEEIEINYSGIPARYEDVIFTINKNKSEDELNIHLASQGIQGEIRYYYKSKEFEFISASDFAGE